MTNIFSPILSPRRTSLRSQPGMFSDIDSSMILNGYNKRERSKWISDAIVSLSKNDDFIFLVKQEFMENSGESTPIIIGSNAASLLDKMIQKASCELVKTHDLQSKILRTAIIQFLMKDVS